MSAPSLLAVAGAALALALPVAAAAGAVESAVRAAGAADAAALAAADAESGWVEADPCELASTVAAAVDTTLESCEPDAASGQVRISLSVQTMFGRVTARARAGPEVA